jgi:hypothetical protein
VLLEGLCKLKKKCNNLIGNRTRDLPACSIAVTVVNRRNCPIQLYLELNQVLRTEVLSPKQYGRELQGTQNLLTVATTNKQQYT